MDAGQTVRVGILPLKNHLNIFEFSIIQHCDDPGCDLGSAEYDCPFCSKRNIDFGDLFYKHKKYTIVILGVGEQRKSNGGSDRYTRCCF